MPKTKNVSVHTNVDVVRVWRALQREKKAYPDRYTLHLFLLNALFCDEERPVQMSVFLSETAKGLPWMLDEAEEIAERWVANGEGRAA